MITYPPYHAAMALLEKSPKPHQLTLPFEPEHGVVTPPEIIVIGDWMVDFWYNCESFALSAEAPVPVVKYNFSPVYHAGGAGNVSENLRAMGWKVRSINQPDPHKTRDLYENVPIKKRYMYQGKQVFRVDEQDKITTPIDSENLIEALDYAADRSLPVVIADYNKGALNDNLVYLISDAQANMTNPFYIHIKHNPNTYGLGGDDEDITYFYNQKEFEQIERDDFLPQLSTYVVTSGSSGARSWKEFHHPEPRSYTTVNTPIPGTVRSTCGAGDVFMAAYITAKERYGHPNPLAIADAIAKKTVTECEYTCVYRGGF